mmetsp:Transcript_31028/g.45659  ORF Transcript_31028/g.45659 Transcript_31028/m.45659 type:complete len:237 (+) Transcript_31028:136-846(+)
MSSMSSSAHQTPSEPHVPCHHNNDREVRSSVPPADWVNHTTSVTEGTAQSHFEFFYQVIFTFVHSALTLLLAPVLKTTRPRSSSRRSSSSQRSRTQRRDTPQSFHREVDPELAMPPHMTPEKTRVTSSNSSSILKSQRRRRPSGEQPPHQAAMTAQAAATAKSVRFPEPIRSRPPLGRISSSIGSVASSANISVGESSSSSSSSSSASSRNGRGRMAPRYTLSPSRAHHTTYFLSD